MGKYTNERSANMRRPKKNAAKRRRTNTAEDTTYKGRFPTCLEKLKELSTAGGETRQ